MTTEAEVVRDLAARAVTPHKLTAGDVVSVVVPDGSTFDIQDLEAFQGQPRRKRGTVLLHDAGSLEQYVNAHRADPASALYADIDAATVTAVLNGHEQGNVGDDPGPYAPGWGDHRAALTLRKTPNWTHWAGKDRQWLTQTGFAEHIEEGLVDIVDPPAADMLEVAQTFQANTRVQFKSSTLLNNGQRQFTYEETIEAAAGRKGNLTVPVTFALGLAVFEGQAEGHRVTARLQTRIDGGDLKLRYLLDRPHDVLRAAFDTVVGEIETGVQLLAYRGTPPVL